MSIEAIKEALAAVQPCGQWHRSGAAVDVDESEEWARARIEVKANKLINRKLSAFIAACNPVAIRSLIERLEAAEKDAARSEWLAVRERFASVCVGFCQDGGYIKHRVVWYEGDTEKWMEAEGDSFEAAIDSAMEAGK